MKKLSLFHKKDFNQIIITIPKRHCIILKNLTFLFKIFYRKVSEKSKLKSNSFTIGNSKENSSSNLKANLTVNNNDFIIIIKELY